MEKYILKFKSFIKLKNILLLGFFICFMAASYTNGDISRTVFTAKRSIPIYSVEYPEKKVAITFDCAWGADDIPDIINILDKNRVKATFFLQGQWAEKFPDKVKMLYDSGHDIANHSHSHFKMSTLSEEKIKEEILKCSEIFNDITGSYTNLFRPPYGDYNDKVVDTAKELGYFTIQWDVDSLDWKPDITKEEIRNRIMKNVTNGSIILFHNDTKHTVSMLDEILVELKQKGYGFLPVSEMIYKENYEIDNAGRQKIKN